jgi:hypothetical protein
MLRKFGSHVLGQGIGTLAFLVAILMSAPASASTQTIPVKVKLRNAAGDLLAGKVKSDLPRCVAERTVTMAGDSTASTETDTKGRFAFNSTALFQPGVWTVSVERSQVFGTARKARRCAADVSKYTFSDPGEMSISFVYSPETGATGKASSSEPLCNPSRLYLRRDSAPAGYVGDPIRSDAQGNYVFGPERFESAGEYQVQRQPSTYREQSANGDLEKGKCYGYSDKIFVTP